MKTSQSAAKLEQVLELLNRSPAENFWTGASSSELEEILQHLPLELPKIGRYLFRKDGSQLTISEEERGISVYRLTEAKLVLGIELQSDGIHLTTSGIPGINEIVLLKEALAIPVKALSFRSINAPIHLLDEYADLRAKGKTQGLSASDKSRQEELVKLIGNEYEQRTKRKVIPSSRSTPSSYGESRSSGYRSSGG